MVKIAIKSFSLEPYRNYDQNYHITTIPERIQSGFTRNIVRRNIILINKYNFKYNKYNFNVIFTTQKKGYFYLGNISIFDM